MQFDEQIREALANEAASIGPDAMTRLRRTDYKPRSHTLPPRLAGVVAVGAAGAAGTLLAIGGAGPQTAFAGWRATPTQGSAAQTAAVEAECATRLAGASKNGGQVSAVPQVADTRGPYTLVVYDAATCVAGPGFLGLHGVEPRDQISISTSYDGGSPYTISTGPVPADATAVSLTLQDGSSVQATVDNSLFAAWWPSVSPPASISITTPSGTQTQPLNFPPPPSPTAKTARRHPMTARRH